MIISRGQLGGGPDFGKVQCRAGMLHGFIFGFVDCGAPFFELVKDTWRASGTAR